MRQSNHVVLGTQGNGARNDNTIYGCTNRDALNFNPSATYDDRSCSFGDDDTPVDGNFDQLDDLINQKLAAFLDGLQGNITPTGGEDSFGNELPYGAPETDPTAFQQPAQAGILWQREPLGSRRNCRLGGVNNIHGTKEAPSCRNTNDTMSGFSPTIDQGVWDSLMQETSAPVRKNRLLHIRMLTGIWLEPSSKPRCVMPSRL